MKANRRDLQALSNFPSELQQRATGFIGSYPACQKISSSTCLDAGVYADLQLRKKYVPVGFNNGFLALATSFLILGGNSVSLK
jgi:hypothetical protein